MTAVQDNLAQERKLFARANTALLQSILSPIQAGLLMLDAWPAHCDCFAFATVAMNKVRLPNATGESREQEDHAHQTLCLNALPTTSVG